jgi:hypothetical protein
MKMYSVISHLDQRELRGEGNHSEKEKDDAWFSVHHMMYIFQ